MNFDRWSVARLLHTLTGGDSPAEGETIVFNREGWLFGSTGYPPGLVKTVTPAAGVVTLDFTTSFANKVVLSADATFASPTGLRAPTADKGMPSYVLFIERSGVAAITLTWNSIFKWPEGLKPGISSAAGALDIITFLYDGTNIYGVRQGDFLAAPRV